VVYPVLEFREKKQTFAKIEGCNVDFSHVKLLFLGQLARLYYSITMFTGIILGYTKPQMAASPI